MKVVSRQHSLKHYQWGEHCDGWNLVDNGSLSVKLEKMPPHAAEKMHYHLTAQQFFFILKGMAVFETEEGMVRVAELEGIHIPAGVKHRILNETEEELEFILSSQPSTQNDRILVDPT